jgi:hypothetical protein
LTQSKIDLRFLGGPLAFAGLALAATGVLFSFLLEHYSDFSLQYYYIPLILVGDLAAVSGTANYARGLSARSSLITGLVTLGLTLAAWWIIPMSIHGWTGSFMLVLPVGLVVGGVFLTKSTTRVPRH